MLTKILIANRGEIAIRVMRTCRELGITTVAVYSELDRDAAHTRYADEAYALGGQTAAESYLNTDAILDAIRKSGADGVHPGYGFFSENADFARAVSGHGRDVDRAAARGDRGDGRQDLVAPRGASGRASRACPARRRRSPTRARSSRSATSTAIPVAIKAAYGGGGRGMKVVQRRRGARAPRSIRRSAKRRRTSGGPSATSSAT